jgi:preprotein translocase subunit SecD
MRLELPNLGPVTIFLDMDAGTRFAIRVVPDDAAAANRLRAGQDDIAGRLAGAGCTLTALQVDDHGCT